MMRHFFNALMIMAALTTVQAQTNRSLEDIAHQWTDVTIRDVNDGSLPTVLRAFDRTWHTAAVGDALDMLAKRTAQGLHHEESGYAGLFDAENDYIEVFYDVESYETMQACCRRRADGHGLLVIMLGSHAEGDIELLLSYDYDPQACTLVPEEGAIDGLAKVTDPNMIRSHELPQRGDELEVVEYYEEDVTEYRFAWDGSKFKLGKKVTQCYDCNPVLVDDEYVIPVTLAEDEPTIADFVDASFGNGDVLPEMLGDIRTAWHRCKMNKSLPSHTTFVLDKNRGYMRFERKWEDGGYSVAEMCYWNCADRRHKLVAQSIATYDDNNRYVCSQYDGYMFSLYDAQKKSMSQAILPDIIRGDYTDLEDMAAVVFLLPRTGKDIVVKRYTPSGVKQEKLLWDGNKFERK